VVVTESVMNGNRAHNACVFCLDSRLTIPLVFVGPFTCGVLPTSGILIATPTVPFAIRLVAYVNPIHYVVGSEILNQFQNRTVVEVRLPVFLIGFSAELSTEPAQMSQYISP
jgi:hypothetical protein